MAVGTREIRRSNAGACTRMYLHMMCLPGTAVAGSITSMTRRGTRLTTGQDRGWLSPCVCNTLRMVTRAVTQLYDDVLRPSGLRVTQFSILATIARMGEANLKVLEAALRRPDDADAQPQPSGARWCDRACVAPRRADQGDAAHIERERGPEGRAAALGPGARQGPPRIGDEGLG